MTREERKEAIEYLKKYKELDKQLFQIAPFTSVSHNVLVKCLRHWDTAIQALEQEPCEDAISRQAVLDLIADYDLSMGQVVKGIHALPSVKPQCDRRIK